MSTPDPGYTQNPQQTTAAGAPVDQSNQARTQRQGELVYPNYNTKMAGILGYVHAVCGVIGIALTVAFFAVGGRFGAYSIYYFLFVAEAFCMSITSQGSSRKNTSKQIQPVLICSVFVIVYMLLAMSELSRKVTMHDDDGSNDNVLVVDTTLIAVCCVELVAATLNLIFYTKKGESILSQPAMEAKL